MNNNQELELMRERYLKLVDMHGQLQIQNSLLEDKILSIVETYSNEKNLLEQSLMDAKQQIVSLQDTINELQIDKQRYKDDCNLAVRLLHRHPNEFVSTTSGQIQEQLKNRYEPTPTNQSTSSQRSVLIPTFPPTFVSLPPMITTYSSSSNTQTMPAMTTPTDNLRLTAEALFKSNSVHRCPSTQFTCSNCQKTIKCCDVSVQTSLDDNTNHNGISRLRLVSLTSSDDGLSGGDGAWLSLDSPHPHMTTQEYQRNYTGQTFRDKRYEELPASSIPGMYYV